MVTDCLSEKRDKIFKENNVNTKLSLSDIFSENEHKAMPDVLVAALLAMIKACTIICMYGRMKS